MSDYETSQPDLVPDTICSDEILNWVLSELKVEETASNRDLLRRVVTLAIRLTALRSIHFSSDRAQQLQNILETILLGHTRAG